MNEEKIHDIEATIAHQEQQIQDLSEMVTKQWDEIAALKVQLLRVQSKVEEATNSDRSSETMSVSDMAASEKPPHY